MYDTKDYVDYYSDNQIDFCLNLKDKLLFYLHNNKKMPKNMLDLGCGTGVFLNSMQKQLKLHNCVGLDLSKEMINFCKERIKNKNIAFVLGDMTKFSFKQKFDLITCNYNAVNHVLNFSDWEDMFIRVYEHLNFGGIFAFDINTLCRMKNYKNRTYYRETKKYNCVSSLNYENEILTFSDTIYIKQPNGLYKILKQKTEEKGFENKKIKTALKQAGFKNIKFLNRNYEKCNIKTASQLFVICEK